MPPPRWERILVHHSASPDTSTVDTIALDRAHRAKGWRMLGYHFTVERLGGDYHALMGRPLHWEGSHCPGENRRAIGVCLIGDFTEEPPPDRQLDVAALLLAGLCHACLIPSAQIHPHSAHRATECPGRAFPLDELRRRVAALLAERYPPARREPAA
jgi:N-acetylmuramoyl-L-alanine amidase